MANRENGFSRDLSPAQSCPHHHSTAGVGRAGTYTRRYSHFEHLNGDRQGPCPAQGAVVFSEAIILKEQRVSPMGPLGRWGDRQRAGQSLLDTNVQWKLGQARQHVGFTKPLLCRPLRHFHGPEVFRRRRSLLGQVQGARGV